MPLCKCVLFLLDPQLFLSAERKSNLMHGAMVGPGLQKTGLVVPSHETGARSLKQVSAHLCVAQTKQNVGVLFNGMCFISACLFFFYSFVKAKI